MSLAEPSHLRRFSYCRKFRIWFKHALKGQKPIAQGNGHKQHALKGQKLIAQGNALGIIAINKTPCKGKSFMYCLGFKSQKVE